MVAYAIAQHPDARGVGLCVGAALDFLSGRTERAPKWMRMAGLEWLHRLLSEPGRLWKRYLVAGPKVFSLFAAWRASMAA
jgi:exopolysaccharide biosynthesis WecB/TagA/CpsF family protein